MEWCTLADRDNDPGRVSRREGKVRKEGPRTTLHSVNKTNFAISRHMGTQHERGRDVHMSFRDSRISFVDDGSLCRV